MELNYIIQHLIKNNEIYLLIVCATLGSVKAITELDRDKTFCYKGLDSILGIVAGTLVSLHYSENLSIWFRCGLSMIAGALGALFIETVLQMLPQVLGKVIDKYLSTGSYKDRE